MERPQKYQAKVYFKNKLTNWVYWLGFKLLNPANINFYPGQRALFNVGPKRNNYSLCSPPSLGNNVEVCVDTAPNGIGSQWIVSLKEEDPVEFLGALGTFMLSKNNGPKIFVATGTGVSPLRSMILTLVENNYQDDIYLYFGERFEEDIFWKDQFEDLAKKYPNFHYSIVLTKPTFNWKGGVGYVQNQVEKDLLSNSQFAKEKTEFYLCGNGKMVESAVALFCRYGILRDKIFTERFYEVSA